MNTECSYNKNRNPLKIKNFPSLGIVEIDGKKYSYEFIRVILRDINKKYRKLMEEAK